MALRALTPTSHLVLGLVRLLQPCTSYDMKQLVNVSIGNFWPFPHSQLYAEPARLVEDGLLVEEQEQTGRRRRLYRLTEAGEEVLDGWVCDPSGDGGELRDEGLLKLFFADSTGPDAISALARAQAKLNEGRLDELERLKERIDDDALPAQLATLDFGLRWYRTAADFWNELAEQPPTRPSE